MGADPEADVKTELCSFPDCQMTLTDGENTIYPPHTMFELLGYVMCVDACDDDTNDILVDWLRTKRLCRKWMKGRSDDACACFDALDFADLADSLNDADDADAYEEYDETSAQGWAESLPCPMVLQLGHHFTRFPDYTLQEYLLT